MTVYSTSLYSFAVICRFKKRLIAILYMFPDFVDLLGENSDNERRQNDVRALTRPEETDES